MRSDRIKKKSFGKKKIVKPVTKNVSEESPVEEVAKLSFTEVEEARKAEREKQRKLLMEMKIRKYYEMAAKGNSNGRRRSLRSQGLTLDDIYKINE